MWHECPAFIVSAERCVPWDIFGGSVLSLGLQMEIIICYSPMNLPFLAGCTAWPYLPLPLRPGHSHACKHFILVFPPRHFTSHLNPPLSLPCHFVQPLLSLLILFFRFHDVRASAGPACTWSSRSPFVSCCNIKFSSILRCYANLSPPVRARHMPSGPLFHPFLLAQ